MSLNNRVSVYYMQYIFSFLAGWFRQNLLHAFLSFLLVHDSSILSVQSSMMTAPLTIIFPHSVLPSHFQSPFTPVIYTLVLFLSTFIIYKCLCYNRTPSYIFSSVPFYVLYLPLISSYLTMSTFLPSKLYLESWSLLLGPFLSALSYTFSKYIYPVYTLAFYMFSLYHSVGL